MPDIKIEAPPTEIHTEVPTQAPEQVDSSSSFDFDDITAPVTKSKTDDKPQEKPKESNKKPDEIPIEHKQVEESKPVQQELPIDDKSKAPAKRDFSVFDDEDKEIAKLAPNKTFDLLKERLPKLYAFKKQAEDQKQEIEKLKAQLGGKYIPDAWAEHPEAYTLGDEYRQLDGQYRRIDFEVKHWQDQMRALKRGESWRTLTGFDEKGNPILSEPIEGTPEHEVAISGAINDASFARQQVLQQANQIKDNFKNIHTQATSVVKDYLIKAVDKLPAEQKPAKEDVELFIKNIPPQFRGNVMTEVSANLFGVIKKLSGELAKLKSSQNKVAAIASDAKAAGPKVTKATGSGKSPKKDDTIDFEDIKKEYGI